MPLLEAVRIDGNLLAQRPPEEEHARDIAARLLAICSQLSTMAEPESYARYQKIAAMAENLYRYCSASVEAQENLVQSCMQTLRQINQILEESEQEAASIIRKVGELPYTK